MSTYDKEYDPDDYGPEPAYISHAKPKRQWVGLTNAEQIELYKKNSMEGWGLFYAAIEAKLKERNE